MSKIFLPNVPRKTAANLGCFLSKQGVEAARKAGVLIRSYPTGLTANKLQKCLLTEQDKGELFIAEIKNGTDKNVLRNMAAALCA